MAEIGQQVFEMFQNASDEEVMYVIDVLKLLLSNRLSNKENGVSTSSASAENVSPEADEAWDNFKKYKGIIDRDINYKAELAESRDERYADFI